MPDIKLNKEQIVAVEHGNGPLLVIAGAGTGKTTVVTERIKYLVASGTAKTSEILGLTFTDKAAREMEERVDVVMPLGYAQMSISTFHSFCDRVLRDDGLAIGIDTSYKLMTSAETVQFVKDNLFEFKLKYFRPLGNPTKFIKGLIQHFSRLQDEDILPADYVRWINGKMKKQKGKLNSEDKLEMGKWKELAGAYKTYNDLKTKESYFDFGDLIVKTLELFRKRPNILRQYQEKFKYILVDEFQDTNIAQNELVKLLAKNKNITVVADDDQSIYRFRGAAVSNVVQFRKSFPKTKVVTLTKNYRSTQDILDKSYDLIQHNNPDRLEVVEDIDKKLISQVKGRGEIRFIHVDKVSEEAEKVSKEIDRLVGKENIDHRDIAILVRANNQAEPFVQVFKRFGIPHQFLGPGKLFQSPEISQLISYLKVLYDLDDSLSMYRVLSINELGINQRDLVKLTNKAKKDNLSLLETCEQVIKNSDNKNLITKDSLEKISNLVTLIQDHLERSRNESAGHLVYSFLEETNLLQVYLDPDSIDAKQKSQNIALLFEKLKTYESTHEDVGVRSVVDWIDLLVDHGESPLAAETDWSENDAVNILTIHSAKGLEFPVIFLVNLVANRFPSVNRREQIPIANELIKEVLPQGDYHMQEERRLFYVGMTRAKSRLYLTAANYYGEAKRAKRLSPFIFEALGDTVVSSEQSTINNQQLAFTDYKPKAESSKVSTIEGQLQKLHIDYLSYSQIQTFEICPLHYKLTYILKIPTKPSAPLSFGSSMHETLNDFYLSMKAGRRATKKLILDLLEKNWIKDGFLHSKHQRDYRIRGGKYLLDYLKNEFDPVNLPLALEKSFLVTIKNTKEGSRIKIGGKMDRIDQLPQGKIEIIDYKTGERVPAQKEVDKNEQLTFYALAASKIKEPPIDKDVDEIVLSLYFFEGQQKISTTRTKAQLREFEKKLFETRDEIEKSDFKCSNNFFCQNCEYKELCNIG